jgi:Tfp pilus assembly protein FimT
MNENWKIDYRLTALEYSFFTRLFNARGKAITINGWKTVSGCRDDNGNRWCSPSVAQQNIEAWAQSNFRLNQWHWTNVNGSMRYLKVLSIQNMGFHPVGAF